MISHSRFLYILSGAPACTTLAATSQMTSLDVIIKVLRDSNIQTDHNLFTLTRVTMNSNTGKGTVMINSQKVITV